MFCIKCGKKAEIGNFCSSCFLGKESLFEIKDFLLYVCDCGSYYDKVWRKADNDIIKEQIGKRIKTKYRLVKKEIALKSYGNRVAATIVCYGIVHAHKKKEERKITITIKKRKCDTCVKLLGRYYEAVLQIRGEYNKIFNKIKSRLPKTARTEKTKHGYDIRFLKKSEAAKIAKALKVRYEVKSSFKFVATKKGKKLYRNYYSVR